MKIFELFGPGKVVYGEGAILRTGEIACKYGKKALIVTGRYSAKKSGVLDKLIENLSEAGVESVWFNDLESDPVVQNVEEGVVTARAEEIDLIIALGGGSAIDTAKSIGVMLKNTGKLQDYEFEAPQNKGIPLIAIPTTAGTGSEATKGAVITDEERKIKMCIASSDMIPDVAILDPELTLNLPHDITCATGMDALTHAIETYIASVATPMAKFLAMEGIRLIAENFVRVMDDGQDLEARGNMLLGQFFAGWAISNSATALVHAMSRPLGVYFHVPHGQANAILLARVMRFNKESILNELVEMAPCFSVEVIGREENDIAEEVINAIADIYDHTGLPKKLSEVGVERKLLPTLAHDAFVNRSNRINPRVATEEEILEMYYELF